MFLLRMNGSLQSGVVVLGAIAAEWEYESLNDNDSRQNDKYLALINITVLFQILQNVWINVSRQVDTTAYLFSVRRIMWGNSTSIKITEPHIVKIPLSLRSG